MTTAASAPTTIDRFIGCLVGGAVGSLVGGWIGIRSTNTLGSIIISVAGACLVIALARMLLPKFKR